MSEDIILFISFGVVTFLLSTLSIIPMVWIASRQERINGVVVGTSILISGCIVTAILVAAYLTYF